MCSRQHSNDSRHVLVNRHCVALVLDGPKSDDGFAVFTDFLRQNSTCFWNACLMRSVASLEYRGCLVPATLLVSGTNFALEVVRSAWARRVLRPPKGFTISRLGDVGTVDMLPVAQTHFAPLSEALCKVVADLNGDRLAATTDSIRIRLQDSFPGMQVPCEDILHRTLGGLIRERKIYHTGNGYFIVSPDTYRQRAVSPLCERQMLMTNEEAIVRLHGENHRECSLAVQVDEVDIAAAWKCSSSSFLQARQTKATSTQVPSSSELQLLERSHSLRVLRINGYPKNSGDSRGGSFKDSKKISDFDGDNMNDIHKSAKQSMLAKILKRMQFLTDKPTKHVVFSAQFPPLEWLDGDKMRCHSVATQTQMLLRKVSAKSTVKRLEPTGSRIPWQGANNLDHKDHYVSPNNSHARRYSDSDGSSPRKNMSLPVRHCRYLPSQRYSHHGTFTNYSKRRQRHRRSSSESPKVQKTLLNGCHSQSTSSRSNADNSDDKNYSSSFGGSALKALKVAQKSNSKEWARVNSCPSKERDGSGLENFSVQSPSGSVDREVLQDVKNISTLHTKAPVTKIGNNIEPDSHISDEMHDQKGHRMDDKVSQAATNPSQINDSSCSEKSVASTEAIKPETFIRPLVLKSFVDIPTLKSTKISPKEIVIDNSVSVEVALEKTPSPKSKAKNLSTTIVTEETTVTKTNGNSKVVTVTSVTTSLSHGAPKQVDKRSPDQSFLESDAFTDKEKSSVNDLNMETDKSAHIIDCSSSCNIVTEVK